MNPRWLVRRLRKMSPGEARKRVREQVGLYASIPRTVLGPNGWDRWVRGELVCEPLPAPDIDAPDHFWIYGTRHRLDRPLPWHRATTGADWPIRHHALLSHHPGSELGDVRPVWELNRLQFLPHLARQNPDRAIGLLHEWLISNPYRMGPAWMSAMEVAIRWIAVHRTVAILGERLPASLRIEVAGLAGASADFLRRHPSTHSSAGNHLIVEALGMVWLAHAQRPRPHDLLDEGRRILTEQVLRQIRPDGTPIEASVWYLGFVIDAAQHWLLIEPEAVPETVRARLSAALQLIDAICSEGGQFPDLADRDDGCILRDELSYAESPFPGLLEVGARQLDRPDWRRSTDGARRRARWFFADDAPRPKKRRTSKKLQIQTLADGGWTHLRRGPGRALLNHGPLGMAPTYGHGHAGALGLTWIWGETALLVDPGTGAYNDDPAFREHYRSTEAHNTVTVDGVDQAVPIGTFLWKEGWRARLLQALDDGVIATCDAYQARFGLRHERSVRSTGPSTLEVVDRFPGASGQPAAAHWHLGPDCTDVALTPTGLRCTFGELVVDVALPPGTAWTVHRGEIEPMRGWLSPRYGVFQPGTVLRVSGRLGPDTAWKTTFEVRP